VEELRVGNTVVGRGQIAFGLLNCGQNRDGASIGIPFIAVNGSVDGPVLSLTSFIHGDEIPGIEVLRRLMRQEIKPASLRGALIAVPIANPLAAEVGESETPLDKLDLCAVFPGDAGGLLTERIAHVLYEEALRRSDYYIDLHSNYSPALEFSIVPTCDNADAFQRALAMAQAFGWPVQVSGYPGSPADAALKLGKPAMLLEFDGSRFALESSVRKGVRGILNVLTYLDMIDGQIQDQVDRLVPMGVYGRAEVRASHGGFAFFRKQVGDRVHPGEVIGTIYDAYGEQLEPITSPVDGFIRTLIPAPGYQLAHSGQPVATFLRITDAVPTFGAPPGPKS
jgi:predicted deacylase